MIRLSNNACMQMYNAAATVDAVAFPSSPTVPFLSHFFSHDIYLYIIPTDFDVQDRLFKSPHSYDI